MTELFDKAMCVAIHKATNTKIIIKNTEWHNGEIYYNCLVPQVEGKKILLCNATYNESEILIYYGTTE